MASLACPVGVLSAHLPSRLGHPRAFVRLCLALVAVLVTWVLPSHAHQVHVGMCSERAESVEAPPPLYPTTETSIEGCSNVDTSRGIEAAPSPEPRSLWSALDLQKDFALLPELTRLTRPESSLYSLSQAEELTIEEHRVSLMRPPRS